MQKIDEQTKEATLYLRDYLVPGGIYPYDTLPIHCEEWLKKGYKVAVISVPGWLMFSGWPGRAKPWSTLSMGKFHQYKTAREALRKG